MDQKLQEFSLTVWACSHNLCPDYQLGPLEKSKHNHGWHVLVYLPCRHTSLSAGVTCSAVGGFVQTGGSGKDLGYLIAFH